MLLPNPNQVQIMGNDLYLVARTPSPNEKRQYRTNLLYSGHSSEGLKNISSYQLMFVIPVEEKTKVPVKTKPFKSINPLLNLVEKLFQHELSREMIEFFNKTREIGWERRDGRKVYSSLPSVIKGNFFDYLYRYGEMQEKGGIQYVNPRDIWIIINAMGNILEYEGLSDTFVQLYTEKWKNFTGTVIQKRGKIDFVETDNETKKNLIKLMRFGLADYDPERVDYDFGSIGWSPMNFSSFRDFHSWLYEKVRTYNQKLADENQPCFILEEAESILENFVVRKR